MNCAVVIRSIRTALAALAALAFVAATALISPSGQAANELNVTLEMKVTVKSDDTFEASFVITDQTDYSIVPPITEDRCTVNYFLVEPNIFANAETKFDDAENKRVCSITRKGKISETNGTIRHEKDGYTIDTSSLDGKEPSPKLHQFYTATFPGEVTQSDGGQVEGDEKNTVSFKDLEGHVVKGKDRPASELRFNKILPWIIGGVGLLAAIGLITMAVVVRRRQQSSPASPEPHPQAFATQGSVPQPFHPGQPTPQQPPVQPNPPQPYQQAPGQSSPPFTPSGTGNSAYPPFPAQAPEQHGGWPPPQQPQ